MGNVFNLLLTSRRWPAPHGIALALLLSVSWLRTGSVAPAAPQTLADQGYRELWSELGPNQAETPHSAADKFRQALAMDAAFPYRWSDLGDVLAAAGDRDSARYCFSRSLDLAPNSPQIAMRAANFHFLEGETGPALQLGATVLRVTASYDSMVFNSWTRFDSDQNEILQLGIGANARAADAFFRFLMGSNPIGPGAESRLFDTWKWMEGHSYVTRPLARAWAGWLDGRGREQDAFLIWKRYVALDSAYGVTNWIDNSGFESEPAGLGFDWRIQPSPGVKAELDSAVARSGHSSLRLEFDGSENLDFHHVAERLWLPAGRYRLTGWMRTANLSTDQGLALVLNGVATPSLSGVHDWTQVSADVTVRNAAGKSAASLGEVRAVRQRS